MSTPPPAGTLLDCWIGGLDSTRLLFPETTPMPKLITPLNEFDWEVGTD